MLLPPKLLYDMSMAQSSEKLSAGMTVLNPHGVFVDAYIGDTSKKKNWEQTVTWRCTVHVPVG